MQHKISKDSKSVLIFSLASMVESLEFFFTIFTN
jgi:hypothetical protein